MVNLPVHTNFNLISTIDEAQHEYAIACLSDDQIKLKLALGNTSLFAQ